jgi:hypothetical protein
VANWLRANTLTATNSFSAMGYPARWTTINYMTTGGTVTSITVLSQ